MGGRAIETRVVESGSRRELSYDRPLPPGLYFLRATRGAVTAVREVVIRR